MAKRRLITLGWRPVIDEEETDSSDSGGTSKKRFRPDFSPDSSDDQEQCNFDVDDADSSFSSDEDNELNGYVTEPLHSTLNLPSNEDLPFHNGTDNKSDLMNNSRYDGYQSFINSFQFFSDEESCDSDSQVTPNYIKIEKGGSFSNRTQKADDLFTEHYVRLLTVSNNVRVIGFYFGNLEIVFMDHPSSVPIIGYLKVTLIAGKASIQGYALQVNKDVTVFSQKQTGVLTVTSHYSEEEKVCAMQSNVRKWLGQKLKDVPADTIRDLVKKNMKYSSTVFILESCNLPAELEFLQLYSPFATSFERRNKSAQTRYVAYMEKEENILKFGHEYEEIFTTIHKHLLRINRRKPGQAKVAMMDVSASSEDDLENEQCSEKISGFHILISGKKKTGKSTMLKYLVNSFLNKYPEVYYLDTDIGQTEFTPPGSISLVKVTEPLFGPAYTHLKKPIKSIFTGTSTPETSPPMHMRTVTKMINYFNTHFPDSILVVNTVGWLTGAGDMIQQHVKKALMPAVEIFLDIHLTPLNISVEGRLLKCTVGFERDADSSTKQGDNRPADLRDWALLAYLGQCQTSYEQPQTLNAFRPVCICWDDIAVYNFSRRLMYNRYYEALINSVVALCHVKESCILSPTNPDYPVTLEDEPDNECVGYGVVRAVDEENHLLYIVTPLGQNSLNASVNAILSGNIILPRCVIYEQGIYGVELDYTDASKLGGTELRKPIRKRSRGHSSKERSFYPH